jgi:hypothetical protein
MFGWLKRTAKQELQPEAQWRVEIDVESIRVFDQAGNLSCVALSALSGVIIETNDSGPWGADVWWLFFGEEDRLSCAFPQGAKGEQAVLDYVMGLPDADLKAMISAMGSADNAFFPVWRRTVTEC